MGLRDFFYGLSFADSKTPRVRPDEIGKTGTEIFAGIISGEEYNNNLRGKKGLQTYDEMRRSDSTVGAALLAVKLPIMGARPRIAPATDDPKDVEIALATEAALFEKMDMSWSEFLRQALLMLDFGHMVFEKVYQVIEVEGKEYIGWKKFAPRLPKSIQKWELADKSPGITQQVMGQTFEIPLEKLMVFVNQKEGDNHEGISLLRTAYKHWYYKDNFYKIEALSFERQGLGIPVIKLPAGHDEKDKTIAARIAQNIRANEAAYMVIPTGWEFEFADMKGGSTRDPETSILHHDRQISKSVLAQFLELGASGGSGSRALSEDHSDLFYMAERAVAQQLVDVINKQAIKEFVDMNFTDVTYYPKLELANIGKIDFSKLSTALGTLVEKGLIIPDATLENYLRDKMELPEAGAENEEIWEKKTEMSLNPPTPVDPNDPKKPGAQPNKNDKDGMEDNQDELDEKKEKGDKMKGKKKASEPKPAFVPWRALTFAEQKVDWKLIQDRLTEMEKGLIADTKRILEEASPALLEELKRNLEKKDAEAIKNMALAYKGPYRKEVLRNLLAAYEFGKRGASKEMKIGFPNTPEADRLALEVVADMVADTTESDILKGMKLAALAALNQNKNTEQIVNAVAIELGKLTDRITYNTAVATVGGSYNQGRIASFLSNEDNIHALQRSEILDARVCNYCLSMDGRIISTKDPMAKATTFHSNCRGIWVAIMKDEAELPPIGRVPQSIASRWKGNTNNFEQLDAPITDPGTLADNFANR